MRKNVLFIAKFDSILKGMNTILSNSFNMQMCPPEAEMVEKMLSVMEVDVVLLYISGLHHMLLAGLCEKLNTHAFQAPLVVFGTPEECEDFGSYCSISVSKYMFRPLAANDIMQAINNLSGVSAIAPAAKVERKVSLAELADSLEADERHCVLLVDDDGRILRAIKMLLEKTYRVNLANSGRSALESIERERPDVVLLDYEMPGMDGRQTLEIIRRSKTMHDLPVFFLTGVSDKERIKEVIHLRPRGYLLKSSDQGEILERLDEFFNNPGK